MKIEETSFIDIPDSLSASAVDPSVTAAKQRFSIVGNSPALIGAIERAVKVAPIDLSVLVVGESGTGKEFFPQIIYQGSPRRHARYIAVNCGAIPEGTIDSELFGHEKGSFTGAVASRKGYFEEADGGTIFLDEVAELPLTTQARLLRVLETGEFLKVGSSTVQKTNIRIVAATNVDLPRAIAEGRFREDLYYRLSTVQINVPPLRDRGRDIELLARRFAADFIDRYRTAPFEFDNDARELFMRFSWPGNVRQLKNVIEQISLFESSKKVSADTLKGYLEPPTPSSPAPRSEGQPGLTAAHSYEREREVLFNMIFSLRGRVDELSRRLDAVGGFTAKEAGRCLPACIEKSADKDTKPDSQTAVETSAAESSSTLADNERRAIEEALLRNDGRRRPTARELNIPERTLYRKIKEYGLE